MKHTIEDNMLDEFRRIIVDEEKAEATLEKYMRDLRAFLQFAREYRRSDFPESEHPEKGIGGRACGYVDKEVVMAYKEHLIAEYASSSVNSMLAAVNCFLQRMGWQECTVKAVKIQKEAFRAPEKDLSKEEYYRLLNAAQKKGNQRLCLLMQTLCATGIRIGELKYITVESLRTGRARVNSKGKNRTVLIPVKLCRKLKLYVREKNIKSGSIFVTRNGKLMDRSNICHEMKKLCEEAHVPKEKIFPHNLRHLFACTYYKVKKDLAHLADLMGHSNVNTTRIYTLVSEKEQAEQIEVLGLVV